MRLSAGYNDMFQIPTLQEYIDLALNAKRVVGTLPITRTLACEAKC